MPTAQVSQPSQTKASAFCPRLLKAPASMSLYSARCRAVSPSNKEQGHFVHLKYSWCWKRLPLFPATFIQCFHITANDGLMGHMQHCLENAFPLLSESSLAAWPCSFPLSPCLLSCNCLTPLHTLVQSQAPSLPPGRPSQGCQSTVSGQASHRGGYWRLPPGWTPHSQAPH